MTHLFIMTDFGASTPTDDGSRPYTGSTPFWSNVSIFMVGGPSQTSTSVGTPTRIRVRVSNSGGDTIPAVSVDAYVMNPFVGTFDPSWARATLHGFTALGIAPGSGSSSPTDAHVVECLYQDPNLGPVPWTPTQADLDTSTNGHLCLIANAYADGDGAPAGGNTVFDVANDPHLGQRNIALLAKTQQMKLTILPAPNGAPTAIDIHQLTAKQALQKGEWWLLRSRRTIARIPGGSRLQIPAHGSRPAIPLTFSRKAVRGRIQVEGLEPSDLHKMALRARRIPSRGLTHASAVNSAHWGGGRYVLPPLKIPTTATVQVERDDNPGSLQAFDVVQRDATGRVLGGFRILSLQD